MTELPEIEIAKKTGNEKFIQSNTDLDFSLLDFWKWNNSDLLSNTARGVLAEFMVARDLGIDSGIRTEWDAYDLLSKEGLKIEIKSSAYIQSWFQKDYSTITFGIQPTRGWDSKTNTLTDEIKRQSDFYVFCVLKHKDQSTINPLDTSQWDFYVLKTDVLNEKVPLQKSISLGSLLKLNPTKCNFGEIKKLITNH